MDKNSHMKGHYIVMDNAPIHTHENIGKYIEYRGYKCVYLPYLLSWAQPNRTILGSGKEQSEAS